MAASGWGRGCDILIFYSPDAEEWCQYLQDLFVSCRQVRSQKMQTYRLVPDASFSAQDLWVFRDARCVLVLLSAGLVGCFGQPGLLPMLQRACHPPQRVVRLLCGVQPDDEDFQAFFPDWAHWQELTCDDEPETYLAAVRKAISEDSGCDSVTDTEPEDERELPFSKQTNLPPEISPGNLMVVQPDRIRCGVGILGTWYISIRASTFLVDAFVSVKGARASGYILLEPPPSLGTPITSDTSSSFKSENRTWKCMCHSVS